MLACLLPCSSIHDPLSSRTLLYTLIPLWLPPTHSPWSIHSWPWDLEGTILPPSVGTAPNLYNHFRWLLEVSLSKVLFPFRYIPSHHNFPSIIITSFIEDSETNLYNFYTSLFCNCYGRFPMSLRPLFSQSVLQCSFCSSTPTITFTYTKATHFYRQQQYINCSTSKILNCNISIASSSPALSPLLLQ